MEAKFLPIGFDKQKTIKQMMVGGLDGVLLTSPESISYVTGYPCLPSSGNPILFAIRNHYPSYAYINGKREVFLVAWEYSLLDIELGVDHLIKHVNADQALNGLRTLLLGDLGKGTVLGVESTCPYQLTSLISSWIPSIKLAIADDIFDQLRSIKTTVELSQLTKSCQIAEKTFTDLIPMIEPGLHRTELVRAAKEGMIHNGASGIGHCTISFGASNPEVEINEVLEEDRLVMIDLGALYYGYASDIRRMLYTGVVPEKMRQLHKIMCEIVAKVGEALVPSAIVTDIYNYAQKLFIENGLDPNFTHFGHTMGLQTEEIWCDKKNNMQIAAGMLVNVELYSMMETGENIGDEETYVVNDNGPVCITKLPKKIIEILV